MFQDNLKALRKKKGITQEELAARLNVVRQTVSKWEKGLSVPDSELLIKLAEILEVPVSRLLGSKIEANVHPTDYIIINQYTLFFHPYPPCEIVKAE